MSIDLKQVRFKLLSSLLLLMALALVACQGQAAVTPEPEEAAETPVTTEAAEPTEAAADTPTPEEAMVTPSVTVEDQEITDGTVTIAEVVSDGPGWLVVHDDDDGPGPVIGYTAVSDGSNSDVVVEIDTDQATETLHAMLHSDDGTEGEYEFPDADPPVQVDGQVVNEPFVAEGMTMEEEAMASTVTMVDSAFEPVELTVSAGTTVQWVNEGDLVHTVTADDDSFDSGDMESGDTFEFTFDEPGEYPYYCVYHGAAGGVGMAGTIIVTEG